MCRPRQHKDDAVTTSSNPAFTRLVIAAAGIIGMGGVMAAAGAAHGADQSNLGAIAMICLAHGPALLALGLSSRRGYWFDAAAILLGLGTVVFASDLLARHFLGHALLPLAAPIGGLGMIGGWGAVIAGGAFSRAVGK